MSTTCEEFSGLYFTPTARCESIAAAWHSLVVPTFGHLPGELDHERVWTAAGREHAQLSRNDGDQDCEVVPLCIIVSEEPEADATHEAVAIACCELYRQSRCLLLSYIVVLPKVRGRGVARHLVKMAGERWKSVAGCFVEVNNEAADVHAVDPSLTGDARDAMLQQEREARQKRHAFFAATGFRRVANFNYVQPRLEEGAEPVRCLDLGWRQEEDGPLLTVDRLLGFLRDMHISCASEYLDEYDVDADPLFQEQAAQLEAVRAQGLTFEAFTAAG